MAHIINVSNNAHRNITEWIDKTYLESKTRIKYNLTIDLILGITLTTLIYTYTSSQLPIIWCTAEILGKLLYDFLYMISTTRRYELNLSSQNLNTDNYLKCITFCTILTISTRAGTIIYGSIYYYTRTPTSALGLSCSPSSPTPTFDSSS